jgi:hypothetical protein
MHNPNAMTAAPDKIDAYFAMDGDDPRSCIGNLCSGYFGFCGPTWPSYSSSHPFGRREDCRLQTGSSRWAVPGRPPADYLIIASPGKTATPLQQQWPWTLLK